MFTRKITVGSTFAEVRARHGGRIERQARLRLRLHDDSRPLSRADARSVRGFAFVLDMLERELAREAA